MSSGILVLSWLLSVGSLNLQQAIQQGSTLAGYQAPSGTFATTLAVEGLLWDHVFMGASVTTYEKFNGGASFSPSESLYTFAVGARTHGVEIGIRHECDHITLSDPFASVGGFYANKTEVYVSVSGKFSPF